MPSRIIPRRVITVDDSGTIVRQPTRIPTVRRSTTGGATRQQSSTARGTSSGSLGTRGNSIAISEAVRAVQYPESNSPRMRAYFLMGQQERETLNAVQRAGGDDDFLYPGQRAIWRDEREQIIDDNIYLFSGQRMIWRGGSEPAPPITFERLPPALQVGAAFLQGIVLDRVFNVDLTGENGQNWTAWMSDPERINMAFGATVRNAAVYNEIAASIGFETPNMVWLFQNINGPMELRTVSELDGNLYAQTRSPQRPIQFEDPPLGPFYTWGGAWASVFEAFDGVIPRSIPPTEILLTDAAFESGTTRYGTNFSEGFVLDHEYSHVPQINWNIGGMSMRDRFAELLNSDFSDMPEIGARSSSSYEEYLADAFALLQTNLYNVGDPNQVRVQEVAIQLLQELISEKFSDIGF